jgi:serine/threonine-protein kinase
MDRIGEYLIKRLIGEGGMGKVYEAEERLSKRKVALKVLRPELTRSDEGRRLFLNEMQILAHLEHPNVVRSLASMEVDGQLVMALEFLSGRTLREELTARGTLPWPEAVEIAVQIAEALEVAHSQEPAIVHRDLKPENVMLTSDAGAAARLKVMDFGIAKVLEAVHATNTQSIGTLQYMSPEQIDAHTIDARSDLYALGLILYEMIAGAPPFRSASPRELLNMQCTSAPPQLGDDVRQMLPRGVEELIFALLEKSPASRPASAREVVERLSPFRPAGDRAARPAKTSAAGASRDGAPRRTDTPAAPSAEPRAVVQRTSAPAPSPSSSGGDEKKPPRTDTIALVERATSPREMSTLMAIALIVLLSLVAGLATYVIRVRSGGPSSSTGTATASATVKRLPSP